VGPLKRERRGADRLIASSETATRRKPVLRSVLRAGLVRGKGDAGPMASVLTGWLLAFVLGARHASEPDHLVAVSTLIAEQRGALRAMLLGAVWGVGHSISLFTVGLILLYFHLELSDPVADLFELGVVVMLLALGTRSIVRAFRASRPEAVAAHEHHHAQREAPDHGHSHAIDLGRTGRWTPGRRPLMIGLVHGLAGSGALTALVLSTMPSLGSGLVYMASFGAGSVLGMALLTGLVGLPLRRLTQHRTAQAALSACAGLLSFSLAIHWGWPVLLRLRG
jgi:ABC-type nickel/cobalt efflux system permease component RcnA